MLVSRSTGIIFYFLVDRMLVGRRVIIFASYFQAPIFHLGGERHYESMRVHVNRVSSLRLCKESSRGLRLDCFKMVLCFSTMYIVQGHKMLRTVFTLKKELCHFLVPTVENDILRRQGS